MITEKLFAFINDSATLGTPLSLRSDLFPMDKLNTEAMSNDFLHYKNEFCTTLYPIIDLLEYKKSQLPLKDWEKFMNSTKARIISNPEQFLGKDYPQEPLLRQLVQEIFADFFEKENVEI